ncbi:MAG: DNRLRE domain-containing protein [Desulfarculaceae bacterium]|nr:DNRLRE domain-containing protein [Desulfarculaceae bacterium]MCF8100651.1 DNRLRE domain-containing protein [Desulfarculaceae bacterium]
MLFLAGAARAESITFDYATGITDTMLNKYSPNSNYGNYGYEGVYNSGSTSAYQSLLRFDDIFGDGGNQIPLDSTISNATLRLYLYTGSGLDRERSLYSMTGNWSESSTWNSMEGGVSVGSQTVATADATYTENGSRGFLDIDVTSSLQAWANGATNLGWVIIGTGSNWNYSFYSSSDYSAKSKRPTLNVDYSGPVSGTPEPGTLLLMGSAMAFIGWRGRRRLRRRA